MAKDRPVRAPVLGELFSVEIQASLVSLVFMGNAPIADSIGFAAGPNPTVY